MVKHEIEISVSNLLDLLYLPKDLGTSFLPSTRGQEGTIGHHLLTSQRPSGYRTEVPIEYSYDWEDYQLTVRGRIDGLLESATAIEVEEIKTTYATLADLTLDRFPVHQAQLKLYLYFIMNKYPNRKITGRLSYLNLNDLSEKSFPVITTLDEAQEFFIKLAQNFLATQRGVDRWISFRNESLSRLLFPFLEPRPGQDELLELTTQALEQERDLFVEAATGIGKTVAVLFPALKQLSKNPHFSQIFFLTAKTAGKEILKKTILAFQQQGLHLRTVFIESKERVCLSPGCRCHPQHCQLARDYYPKMETLLPPLLEKELITPDIVLEVAKDNEVCPYQLSLDLALRADLIICDYNYVFDPGIYLRRFFLNSGRKDFLFLIDEAHNLVTRGREMYSSSLSFQDLTQFHAEIQNVDPKIANTCSEVEEFFRIWVDELQKEKLPGIRLSRLPDLLEPALERLAAAVEFLIRRRLPSDLRERIEQFYFELTAFTRIVALVNKDYAIYIKHDEEKTFLRLFCINPGPMLRRRIEQGRMAIFFSATLSPLNYFRELLGGSSDSLSLQLQSPFPRENRLYLHVPGIDTRYRNRESSLPILVRCINDLVTSHTGNYLIFFPSYTYLKTAFPLLKQTMAGKAALYTQSPSMKDTQKKDFLQNITSLGTGRSNVGLAVLGGLFGEGIDLPGEQLVGVMIIGPALPVLSDEQELIRMYFDERNGEGFLFAYLISGLIRVIQSAGRVFRTPEDQGVVLLVDDRFLDERYQELLPSDWFMPGRAFSNPNYQKALSVFWNETS